MPALSFKKRFFALIKSGKKRQTIRSMRKRPIRPGDTLHLFIAMRTTNCQKIGSYICTSTEMIVIDRHGIDYLEIHVNNRELSSVEIEQLARADGFDDVRSMREFFEDYLPFEGQLIKWNDGGQRC